jgi:hypothetical protein
VFLNFLVFKEYISMKNYVGCVTDAVYLVRFL